MSGDSYGPPGEPGTDAQFTVNVDGLQIGGLQSTSAQKSAGERETFTFRGDFAPGEHDIVITFANNTGTQGDKTTFGRTGGDRNLYIDKVIYNGQTISDTTTPVYESPIFPPEGTSRANATFSVNDDTEMGGSGGPTTTPAPVTVGSGPDRLTLRMAEDPYRGDAEFTVKVDGEQVGGTLTTTAISWQGQQQTFTLYGDWGPGPHTVTITYLSDKIGETDSRGMALDNQDQNLYVMGISYNGVAASGTPWELTNIGSRDFSVPAGGVSGGGEPEPSFVSAPAPRNEEPNDPTATTDDTPVMAKGDDSAQDTPSPTVTEDKDRPQTEVTAKDPPSDPVASQDKSTPDATTGVEDKDPAKTASGDDATHPAVAEWDKDSEMTFIYNDHDTDGPVPANDTTPRSETGMTDTIKDAGGSDGFLDWFPAPWHDKGPWADGENDNSPRRGCWDDQNEAAKAVWSEDKSLHYT